jgi:bifunctional non-homologous end joining protein LigD
MKSAKSIKLFFQEGSSDKVYNAAIVEDDGAYSVQVEWGRRGANLNRGTKAVKVSLAAAEKAFDKVVKQKTRKGYEAMTEEVAPAAVAPPDGQGSGSNVAGGGRAKVAQRAQLLNSVCDEAQLEALLTDERIVVQQKFDGVRVLVHIGEEIIATNRSGEITRLDDRLATALRKLDRDTILDGEVVSRGSSAATYWVFDLIAHAGEDMREEEYLHRHGWLTEIGLPEKGPIRVVATATTTKQKRALLNRLEKQRAEGAVFKHAAAPYTQGRPASGGAQLKYKFVKSADVVITENAGNAYRMAVNDGERLRDVGKVFAGTTNASRADLDARLGAGEQPVAEVQYLYATDNNQLYQPVFTRLRLDKGASECTIMQLERTDKSAVAELDGEHR